MTRKMVSQNRFNIHLFFFLAFLFSAQFIFAAKIGIYPGSFDPIHVGHLEVARAALEKLKLDAVYLMPNGTNPRKPNMSPIKERAQIIEAALEDLAINRIRLFSIEQIEQSAVSGDVEQAPLRLLELARNSFPKDTIYQILGTDSLTKVIDGGGEARLNENWRLAVCNRPGIKPIVSKMITSLQKMGLLLPFDSFSDLVISSSAIRKACKNGDVSFLHSVLTSSSYNKLVKLGAHDFDQSLPWLDELLKLDGEMIPTDRHPMAEPVILKQKYELVDGLPPFKAVAQNPMPEATNIDFSSPHSLGDVSQYLSDKLTPVGMKVLGNRNVEVVIFPGSQQQLSHWLASNGIHEGLRITRNRSYITLGIHLVKKANGKFMAVIDEVYGLDRMRHTQAMVAGALAMAGRDKNSFRALYEIDNQFPTDVEKVFAQDLQPVVPGTIDAVIIGFHWKIINELEKRLAFYRHTNNVIALTHGRFAEKWRRWRQELGAGNDKSPWPRKHFPNQDIPFSFLAFTNAAGRPVNILVCRNVYGDQLKSLVKVLVVDKRVPQIILFGNAGGLAAGAAVGDKYFPDEVRRFDSSWSPVRNFFAQDYVDSRGFHKGPIYSVFSPLVETERFIADLKAQNAVLVDVENGYVPELTAVKNVDIGSIVVVSDIPGSGETLAHLEENETKMGESITDCIDAIISHLQLTGPSDHPFPIAH